MIAIANSASGAMSDAERAAKRKLDSWSRNQHIMNVLFYTLLTDVLDSLGKLPPALRSLETEYRELANIPRPAAERVRRY